MLRIFETPRASERDESNFAFAFGTLKAAEIFDWRSFQYSDIGFSANSPEMRFADQMHLKANIPYYRLTDSSFDIAFHH